MNTATLRRLYELLDDVCKSDSECPECFEEMVPTRVGAKAEELRAIVREEWLAASRREVAAE